jgi:5-methylcytosine-specific restriction protein A
VTSIREIYGADAKKSLIVRAADYRARLGSLPKSFQLSEISLNVPSNSLGAFYEAGNICAAFYSAEALPETAVLVQDLRACLDLYRILADKDVALTEPVEVPAGGEFIEDLTRFRWHRRIDRDARAIQLVKKAKGYTCEVCGFNFGSRYGELGKDFIEIHHLVPISELQGLIVSTHPEHDYAALCSNCHSMIHRMKVVHDIEALRARLR